MTRVKRASFHLRLLRPHSGEYGVGTVLTWLSSWGETFRQGPGFAIQASRVTLNLGCQQAGKFIALVRGNLPVRPCIGDVPGIRPVGQRVIRSGEDAARTPSVMS